MKNVTLILLLVFGCAPLGGCGALVAGAAGGAVAGAVIEQQHRYPPPPYPYPY
jgi:hypothetical protein